MSGLGEAGLAFGVVPVIVTAAQAYRTVYEHLNTFRNRYSVAVRLLLRFRCIQARIRNTFGHFLSPVLQESDPWRSFQEDSLTAEQQDEVAAHVYQSLGVDSAAILLDVFQEIAAILEEVGQSLGYVERAASRGSKFKGTQVNLKSCKEAWDVIFNESQYEKQLENLRRWVDDLEHLLATKGPIPKGDDQVTSKQSLPLPSSVTAINEASKQLGTSLEKAWTCLNTQHNSHNAALWFNAELDMNDAVHMDVAISCRLSSSAQNSDLSGVQRNSESRIWLHAKSASSTLAEGDPQEHKRLKRSVPMPPPATIKHQSTANCTRSSLPVGRATTLQSSSTMTVQPTQDLACPTGRNLSGLPSMCCYLCTVNFSRPPKGFKCCRGMVVTARGYVETPQGYEHFLFDNSGRFRSVSDNSSSSPSPDSHPVTEYLSRMTQIDQVKTAYEITMALLKFRQTLWLEEDWSLNDIFYLGSSSFDSKTLHLTKRLSKRDLPAPNRTTTSSASSELQTLLGIRNTPLASLGHALLELAHRTPLKSLRQPGDPHNAVAARRLVNGVDKILGVRYRRLVRKCLEADFVVDCTDLSDGRLQTAVYNSVALELERLTKDFERVLTVL